MKIGLIIFVVSQNFLSILTGWPSLRHLLGLSFFWSLVACLLLNLIDFNLYYFFAEGLCRLLAKIPWLNRLVSRARPDAGNRWMQYCRRWGRWGLIFPAALPHFLMGGIAAQKIFAFRNGYWFLFVGTVLKVAVIAFGMEYSFRLIRYLILFTGY